MLNSESVLMGENSDRLFERRSWFYSFCRERLFADHTEEISQALEVLLLSRQKPEVLEVGCGPGHYARRLAMRFPQIDVTGIDLSESLLARARSKAARDGIANCKFLLADALTLPNTIAPVDLLIASRLFLIMADPDVALSATFAALKPGGLMFIAEPVSRFRAAIPIFCMRVLDFALGNGSMPGPKVRCQVFGEEQFSNLLNSQPWKNVRRWNDGRYQYAVCRKAN
ncbi:MAG: class I SAM-dependent methyltransferase [Acidobacteriota bacterium]|nr:class I SAM-dependent methyltransferase [Acidobacteriota bacterium]